MTFRKITLLCVLACSSSNAMAENWPQWRGPRGDGVSTEKGIATQWSQNEHVQWRSPMPGQGGATPVVWNDRLFVTSADGNYLVLICLSTKDGKELWRNTVTDGNQDARAGEGNSASPSPSTDGQHVWVFFSTGVLACFTIDGKEVWKFDAADRFGKIDIQFGLASTPVLHGDHLYLQLIHGAMKANDDSRTGKVIKLDKLTGGTIWEFDRVTQADYECKHSYASPLVYDDGKQRFLVAHGADCTTGHSLETGKELWRLSGLNGPSRFNKSSKDRTFRFVASPGVSQGSIIVPTAKSGPTVALRVTDDLRGDVTEKSEVLRWSAAQTPDVSIPLVVDGYVYNLHKDGRFQCFELESGKEMYFERIHNAQYRSSPIYADGRIYVCAKDGHCTVLKTGPKFEIVAENLMGDPITASPIVANGVLFLRTYKHVYAIWR